MYGALAEEYGARVALLSGDDVFAEETAPRFPGARFVVTLPAAGVRARAAGPVATRAD